MTVTETPEDIWRRKTDEQLVAASQRLEDYTDAGRHAIVNELRRRLDAGLIHAEVAENRPEAIDGTVASDEDADAPSGYLRRLWRGYVSLPITFWGWGFGGNFAMLGLLVVLAASNFPLLALLVALASVSYSVFVTVAIWRSAGRFEGNQIWAHLARVSIAASIAKGGVDFLSAFF